MMDKSAELKIYKELMDKMRALMAEEEQEPMSEDESSDDGSIEVEPIMKSGDEPMIGSDVDGKDQKMIEEMKVFFGGKKPLLPGKKGLHVGMTEIAAYGPKSKKMR